MDGSSYIEGLGTRLFKVKCDSQFVVNQIKGDYAANGEKMKKYLSEAEALVVESLI